MAVNPNWPTLFVEAEFGANPFYGQVPAVPVYTDLTPRLYGPWSGRRGEQFELGAVQAGEWHGQWLNKDGFLDPSNAASPFAPGVVPFRGFRLRAQYPPSINLVNGDTATGGEVTPLGTGINATPWVVTSSYAIVSSAASATAWQGSQVWQFPMSGGVTPGSNLAGFGYFAALPIVGTPYTASYRIRSAVTGANPTVTPFFGWVDINGNAVANHTLSNVALTGSPTATWTTITHTDTVPAGAVALAFGVRLAVAPASAWTFQADGIQLEQAASASSFTVPGRSYPVFSGVIERYPQTWMAGGTYGLVSPIVDDVMAQLSQTKLQDVITHELLATSNLQWFFPLNDPSGSTTFAEQAGRTGSAGLFTSGYGAGSCSPGSTVTATTPAGRFLGGAGPVVTFNNPTVNQGTLIDLGQAGITGPPATGAWTRMVAIRTTATGGATFWAATNGLYNGIWGPAVFLSVQNGTGYVQADVWAASQVSIGATGSFSVADGNWHLVFVVLSADGKSLTLNVDGVSTFSFSASDCHPVGCADDALGGEMYVYDGQVGDTPFVGDMAHVAQWNTALTPTQMILLYQAWMFAGQNESSNQRYARILRYAGYVGPQALDAGTTTAMLPAADIPGQDALSALQNVVDTEAGRHFVAADGTLTFQSRTRMFLAATPVWTFGENNGEIPFTDIAFDFDPTHISNDVTIAQTAVGSGTSQSFKATDATSIASYGDRTFSRTNQAASVEECRESAYFYRSRYKDPHMRVSKLRVNVGANPALFPTVLAFEIGQRVRVNRRPPSPAATIVTDGFIEQITHTSDGANAWYVDLEISPAPATPYGVFTSLRTTLHAQANAGTNTVVLNALPDAATNPMASNLTGGQILQFGSGATLETVQIAVGGVPVTTAGYSFATVTLAANLAFTHLAGETVLEGNGLSYDSLAAFDGVQFCY